MGMAARVRRSMETFAAGDLGPTLELWSPAVVWFAVGSHPLAGRYVGPQAALRYLGELRRLSGDTFASDVFELRDLEPELVVARFRNRARIEGRSLEVESGLVLDVAGDRITRIVEVQFDEQAWDDFWRAAFVADHYRSAVGAG